MKDVEFRSSLFNIDAYIFDQIKRPLGDSQAEFDQLVLLLCYEMMIDSLKEKDLSQNLDDDSG